MNMENYEVTAYDKADTTKNGKNTESLVKKQREIEKNKYKLRISNSIVILVSKENCTEKYRRQWMAKHNYREDGTSELRKVVPYKGKEKIYVDVDKAKALLDDGYSVVEICQEMGVSRPLLYKHFKDNAIAIPSTKDRVRLFKEKGMTLDEVIRRTKLTRSTIQSYYAKV